MFERSETLFEEASQFIPGGVNSPARAYAAVEGPPPFIESASGATIVDADGNEFIDFVGSWGPMLFGHNPPEVVEAVQEQLNRGMSFGAPTELETRMARTVASMVPSVDVVRMVNSGTEATMSALRLARGATGRDRIVTFTGCYHGHGDSLLVQSGSGGATLGQPDSAGVPEDLARLTISLPFNDESALRETFDEYGEEIAGVIVEPVAGNMGLIKPREGFLHALRRTCDDHGALLIFDEVMTGFRVAEGGVQEEYGVLPDITTLGKIIGGGMPVGAYGGREEIMREVAPDGPVYQAGTLSGNPLAMRAGLRTLELIQQDPPYSLLEEIVDELETAFLDAAAEQNVPLQFHRMGGMFSYYFTDRPVRNYRDATSTDDERFRRFHRAALEEGLYFPPSYFESSFVSTRHRGDVLDRACEGIRQAFDSL